MKKTLISLVILGFFSVGLKGFANVPDHLATEKIRQAHEELFLTDQELDWAFLGKTTEEDRPDIIPCQGEITSEFGMRKLGRHRARMHEGIDIAAPVGTPVVAPADGRVVFVGRKHGYGLTVVLQHNAEYSTLFAHNSRILVKKGQRVIKGQKISLVGNTGRSTGPHVHYEVRINDHQVNPINYI